MTGITVSDEVVAEFNEFKLKRTPYKFILYKIEGDSVVKDVGLESGDFDEFVGALSSEPRFIVADFAYETTDGRPTDKVVFISWIPDDASVRFKMKYSGTKEALKSAFVGISVNLNATGFDEITHDIIIEACNKV